MSQRIVREIAAGTGPVVVATVSAVSGSAPRHLGTMMLFRPDGSSSGTVGGGKVELEAAAAAARAFATRRSFGAAIEMTGAEATGSAPICGGRVELAVEYLEDRSLYEAAAAALDRGAGVILAGIVPAPGTSREGGCLRAVFGAEGVLIAGSDAELGGAGAAPAEVSASLAVAPATPADSGFLASRNGVYCASIAPADRLLILGGGHVGLALARAAAELDFRVAVVDERPDFALPERFPDSVETRCGDYVALIKDFPIGPSTYIVVATPSHQFDLECVRAVMGRGYRYAGFVGSRRKTKMIFGQLLAEGFDSAEVDALRAPIGIDIGAETPAEIAVSILAEIVAARRNSPALAAMDANRARRRE